MNDEQLKQQLILKKREIVEKMTHLQGQLKGIDAAITALEKPEKQNLSDMKLSELVMFAINQVPRKFTIGDIQQTIQIHRPASAYSEASIASSFGGWPQNRAAKEG